MKRSNGFTLVELLAVIIIIGLLGLVAYPAIEKVITGAREDLAESQETTIINGAKNFMADHPYSIPKNDGDELTISLCQLKMGIYVDSKIVDTKTDKMYDCKTKIIVSNNNNKYEYRIDFTDTIEEDVPSKIVYPSVEIDDNYLVYINKNDTYNEPTITIDDAFLFTFDKDTETFICDDDSNYNVIVTYNDNENEIDTSIVGNNLVTYTITNIDTDVVTTIYRNVIVIE